jgi:hypothetical protein
MSNVNLEMEGRVFATPSALTMLVDGVEIHSGQVGAGQPLDTEITLVNIENVVPESTLSASISVTSGVITAGPVWLLSGDLGSEPCSLDVRSNILINGVAPEWPATPVEPMPGGTPENPQWTNWFFELGAGETITFNIEVPAAPAGNASPS